MVVVMFADTSAYGRLTPVDLGELPTGIESPLIAVLVWVAFALVSVVALVVTVVAARRRQRRGAVLLVVAGLLVVGVAVLLTLWSRDDVVRLVADGGCPTGQDGGYFAVIADDEADLTDILAHCGDLQHRLAAVALGGYALAAGLGGLAQLRLSAR